MVFEGKTIDELTEVVLLAEHRAKQHTESRAGEIEENSSKELHLAEDGFLLGAA